MVRFNISKMFTAWTVLITFVVLSCYFITVNAYRDVMPSRHGSLMTNELLSVIQNKEILNEEDKAKIKEIIDRRGYGIRSLGIIKNIDRSKGLQDIFKQSIFVYPKEFDVTNSSAGAGSYGDWTFINQRTELYQERALTKGYSIGLYFLTIAIFLYGLISWFGLKKRKYKLKWIAFYAPPQLVAICVFIFTYIRIY